MKTMISVIMLMLLMGCSAQRIHANESSGVLPCRARDIKITEYHRVWGQGINQWVAECGGESYVCSSNEKFNQATCSKMGAVK